MLKIRSKSLIFGGMILLFNPLSEAKHETTKDRLLLIWTNCLLDEVPLDQMWKFNKMVRNENDFILFYFLFFFLGGGCTNEFIRMNQYESLTESLTNRLLLVGHLGTRKCVFNVENSAKRVLSFLILEKLLSNCSRINIRHRAILESSTSHLMEDAPSNMVCVLVHVDWCVWTVGIRGYPLMKIASSLCPVKKIYLCVGIRPSIYLHRPLIHTTNNSLVLLFK